MKTLLLKTAGLLAAVTLLASLVVRPQAAMAAAPPPQPGPADAGLLGQGMTSGQLASGQAVWYRYEPFKWTGSGDVQTLTFFFTPVSESSLSSADFEIYTTGQVYSGQDINTLAPVGGGEIVSRDGDPNTGESLWQGVLPGPDAYYIRVVNDTPEEVDYWLFTSNVIYPELGAKTAAPVAERLVPGSSPAKPLNMPAGKTVTGRVDDGKAAWYVFNLPDYAYDGGVSDQDLTMFFTPAYGTNSDHVGFEILTPEQLLYRQRGDIFLNTGLGSYVSRDGDPLTGERLWSGQLTDDQVYLVMVYNGSEVPVDFWLFQDDISHPLLGGEPVRVQATNVPAGSDFYHPLDLKDGLNRASLAPGQEKYYSFGWNDFPYLMYGPMYMTMFFTPDTGSETSKVGFDLVSAGDLHLWERGDADEINAFGAGSWVSRDGDPLTGEKLWTGWLFNAGPYYLKVYNGSDETIDYWLFTRDITNTKMGELAAGEEAGGGSEPEQGSSGTESGAKSWNDWHVPTTCVTHCDQQDM